MMRAALEPVSPQSGQDVAAAQQRVQRVVTRVCRSALSESGTRGILLLAADSPEGALLGEWLESAGIEWRRGQRPDTDDGHTLVAHPACKTTLLLSGRLPHCDLLPLGDVWASQFEAMSGAPWTAPAGLQQLLAAVGGTAALDRALEMLTEARLPPHEALRDVAAADEVLRLFEAGRWWRRHTRLVPKLTGRTLGIDLFD